MARWKLRIAHYLNGRFPDMDATEWEYKETDRVTGREHRKRFKVPAYFEAGTIVCHEGRGLETDCVFEGDPGPEMVPLDDEAKALSAALEHKWKHAIEDLPGQGFTASLLSNLEKQLSEIALAKPVQPVVAPTGGVSKEDFEKLQEQFAALMAKNAELEERLPRRGIRR